VLCSLPNEVRTAMVGILTGKQQQQEMGNMKHLADGCRSTAALTKDDGPGWQKLYMVECSACLSGPHYHGPPNLLHVCCCLLSPALFCPCRIHWQCSR
jgi:hypothetical protein